VLQETANISLDIGTLEISLRNLAISQADGTMRHHVPYVCSFLVPYWLISDSSCKLLIRLCPCLRRFRLPVMTCRNSAS
jgi:hypothetical protein